MSSFYVEGEQRAARVSDLFATVARRYDLMNDVQSFGLHRWWKRRLVRFANVRKGERALDICCGTGDLAFALAMAGAEVTGLDFSEPMLAVAESRAQSLEIVRRRKNPEMPCPKFLRGDAQQIPFPDASFDIVTVGYGLRNLADWEAGLREMCRVVRPNGRVLILEFAKPPNALWRAVYFSYLKFIVPLLGFLLCGSSEAYAYILESLKRYPAQEVIAARMSKHGPIDVRVSSLLGGAMTIHCGNKPAAK